MNSSRNPTPTTSSTASAASSGIPSQASDDQRLADAVALYRATDQYSEASVKEHALKRREELLNNAQAIDKKEAFRRQNWKVNEDEYKRLAQYGASKTGLSVHELMWALRGFDQWPIRLLDQARSLESSDTQQRKVVMPHTEEMKTPAPRMEPNPDLSTAAGSKANDTKRLTEAVALYLATNQFNSDSAKEHALKRREDLLKNASTIEEKEAVRLLNSRAHEVDYQRIAKSAAPKSTHLDEPTLIYIQRTADEWPFRLLTLAKKFSTQEKR
jgi:hypothetical protein